MGGSGNACQESAGGNPFHLMVIVVAVLFCSMYFYFEIVWLAGNERAIMGTRKRAKGAIFLVTRIIPGARVERRTMSL